MYQINQQATQSPQYPSLFRRRSSKLQTPAFQAYYSYSHSKYKILKKKKIL